MTDVNKVQYEFMDVQLVEVTVSIPDGIIGIFHWRNPSSRTMGRDSTQPLTEMDTRNTSLRGVKTAGA
jgi:hypothetical protein